MFKSNSKVFVFFTIGWETASRDVFTYAVHREPVQLRPGEYRLLTVGTNYFSSFMTDILRCTYYDKLAGVVFGKAI